MDEELLENKKISMNLIAAPDKNIPKLCTQVLFSLGADGKIILTFIYRENEDQGVVIERIVLSDNKQAAEIVEKLNETIEKSNKIIKDYPQL